MSGCCGKMLSGHPQPANLLASLKPMLDALEEQLTDEERAFVADVQRGIMSGQAPSAGSTG